MTEAAFPGVGRHDNIGAMEPLSPEEIAYLKYSAEHYVRVKNNHISSESKATQSQASSAK